MIAMRILETFSTMMCEVSGLADLLILDIEQSAASCEVLLNLLLMRANLALRRMTGPGLRAPSYHWTKSDFKKEKKILFLWTVFLLPGPPCILLSILKLQNIFIRIILIRHCLQGICSAEIILVRFISITAARNILLWSGCCLVALKNISIQLTRS